ncbi:MAG: hypothetical protein A2138_17630 [Deltaproteobacteria bacterium RBG_16_71_12]|nr:MAG: hypothetical protein A2138_17630 [Deltaproteobacteria bacterium RBG_16_71_12]
MGHPFGVGADDARRQPPGLALVELGLEVVDAVLELAGEPVGHARPLGLERLIGLLQRALRGLQALNGLAVDLDGRHVATMLDALERLARGNQVGSIDAHPSSGFPSR